MKFEAHLIEKIEAQLKQPLPGEEAQYRLAPPYRKRFVRDEIMAHNPRISAVMLLLYEKNGLLHLVFTLRRQYEGVHGGQMSFPGGRKDEADEDIMQTALRETREEIGITPQQIKIIGALSELYIPPSNFLVYPFVGYTEKIGAFTPHEKEVDQVVEIPVDVFMDDSHINMETEIKIFGGGMVRVPAFIYQGNIIWGATAIMLNEFAEVLKRVIKE